MDYNLVFLFILGASIGSFVNVAALRFIADESIIYPPSHCPQCQHRLKPKDLIPIISYLLLKGKCRYCGEKISIQYPIVEFLMGILFVLFYLRLGLTLDYLIAILFTVTITVAVITDLKTKYIPYTAVLICAGLIFLVQLIGGQQDIVFRVLSACILFGVLFLCSKKEVMGDGDSALGALIGISMSPYNAAAAMFWSVVIGGMIGAGILLKDRRSLKKQVPFVPFMAVGSLVALFSEAATMSYFSSLLR